MTLPDRVSLRRSLRDRRRALSDCEQIKAANDLFHLLVNQPFFLRSRRIAFYVANEGELDPLQVMLRSMEMNKRCYLPVLSAHRPGRVSFAPFGYRDSLIPNRWGIPEPVNRVSDLAAPLSLDLVFVPLVGFDSECNRLGMGKGYYDRTFGFRNRCGWGRPMLVGLAYDFQRVEKLPVESWDVPLDAVATERLVYRR
jgi:5-formyltetrahydrofolate cyclo-ligase